MATTQKMKKTFFATPPIAGHLESYFPTIKARSQVLQLLAGPGITFTFLLLQLLKNFMVRSLASPDGHPAFANARSAASQLYNHIWKFFSKAEARDKVGRIVQYGCRSIQGFLAFLPQDSPYQLIKPIAAEVQTTLAWARRTNRWVKEMPHIPALGEAVMKMDWLEATQRAILSTFLIQDHIYWLLKMGILKFQSYTPIQWHRRNLRFVTASHVFNFALCVRELRRIREKQRINDPQYTGSKEAVEKAEGEIYDNKKMMFRYTLTFLQMVHVANVMQFHDSYIGIFGMISSYIDASKQW
jgi:hypothetical protein